MANYATLKAAISAAIKQNGNNEITGALLQQQLLAMVNSLGAGYQFMGVATPTTNPGEPDPNVFYLAAERGEYSNFGFEIGDQDGVCVFLYDSNGWQKQILGSNDVGAIKALFENSQNATLGQSNETDTLGASGTRLLATPVPGSFIIEKVTIFFPSSNNTFRLNEYERNDDGTFKFLRTLWSITNAPSGKNVIGNLNIYVQSGHYIGTYVSGAGVGYHTGEADAFSLSAETGDSIAFVESTGLTLNIQLDGKQVGIETLVNDAENIENINKRFGNLFEDKEPVTFGYLDDTNVSAGGGRRGFNTPFQANAHISKLYVNANTTGNIVLYLCERQVDGGFTVLKEIGTFQLAAGRINVINVDFVVLRGLYIAWASSANIKFKSVDLAGSIKQSVLFASLSVGEKSIPVAYDNYQWDVQMVGETIGFANIVEQLNGLFGDGNQFVFGNQCEISDGTFTFSSGGGLTYTCIHGQPFEKAGILKKIFIKMAAAGTVSFYRAKKTGDTTFDVFGMIGTYNVVSGINEINIDVRVSVGEYLAVWLDYQQPGLAFVSHAGTMAINGCYTTTGDSLGKNLTVQLRGANLCLYGIVEALPINDFAPKKSNIPNGAYLFNSDQQTDDFIGSGWANFQASVANSYIYLNKPTGMDKQTVRVVIQLVDTSLKLGLCGHTYTMGTSTFKGQFAMFDFANKLITLHQSWSGDVSAPNPAVVATQAMFETLYQNRKYILEIEQDTTNKIFVRLYDGLTMEKVEIEYENTPYPATESNWVVLTNYPVGLLLRSGSAKVVEVAQYSNSPVRPKLMIYGDSFTQGMNLIRYGFSSDLCYSHLIKSWLDGDCSISCRGGESTAGLMTKIESDMELFKPKYVLLAIGLNDEIVDSRSLLDFKVNMTKIINAARKYGAEIILQTYSGNGSLRAQYTSWVMDYSLGFRIFDVRSALAIDSTTWTSDPDLFLADGHPNVQGNERMFDLFKVMFADIKFDN